MKNQFFFRFRKIDFQGAMKKLFSVAETSLFQGAMKNFFRLQNIALSGRHVKSISFGFRKLTIYLK